MMKLSEAQEAVDLGKHHAMIKMKVALANEDGNLALPLPFGGIESRFISFGSDTEMETAVRETINKVWAGRLAVIEARLSELGVEVPE